MSNLNTREEKLKLVFAAHPNAKEIFMASDDRAFFTKHDAEGYAQGLKDQEVKKYSRPLVEAYLKVKEGKDETGAGADTGAGAGDDKGAGVGDDTGAGAGADTGAGAGDDTGAGEGDDKGAGAGDDTGADEKATVSAEYEKVIGKKPNNFMKVETMKVKIAEALAAK